MSKKLMPDRGDSTSARRAAARGVLGLSKLLPLLFVACLAHAESSGGAKPSCTPAESAKFVCGIVNSEDLVRLPKTHWVISSGKPGPDVPVGHLFLINIDNKAAEPFFPLAHNRYRLDQKLFGGCPGKPDEDKFDAEGINARPIGNGRFTLYVINHAGRESTEIFEIDTRDKKPTITWIGCVLTPPMPQSDHPSLGNAVAPLPNDAFAISINPAAALKHTMDADTAATVKPAIDPNFVEKMFNGEIMGFVMLWTPGTGWQVVPGSGMAGSNGIEASADGKWLYVDALLEPGIYRLSLGRSPVDRVVIKTTFHPDNIRWGDDGFLYVTGPGLTGPELMKAAMACARSTSTQVCPVPFTVLKVDPRTLQSEELFNEPGGPLFALATGVAKIGHELWLSSVRTTRLAVYPLK